MKTITSLDRTLSIKVPRVSINNVDSIPQYLSSNYVDGVLCTYNPIDESIVTFDGEMTDFYELYNSKVRDGTISNPIPFAGGLYLKLQKSYGRIGTSGWAGSPSDYIGYGFFPNLPDSTLTNQGIRVLFPNVSFVHLFNHPQGEINIPQNFTEITNGFNPVGLCYYIDGAGEARYVFAIKYNGWWLTDSYIFSAHYTDNTPTKRPNSGRFVQIQSYVERLLQFVPPSPPPGGGSTEGGGDGDFDNTTTTIPLPDLPVISLANLGIVKQYQIGQSDITNLSNFLWDTGFETLFTKWMQDPTEALISLRMCPVPPITEAGPTQVYIGSVEALGVNGNLLTERYIEVDMGSLTIPPYWGNFLDYNPHTKVEVYIPYSGFQKLDTDIVMNSTINLRYRIDYLSGESVAIILVDKGEENLQAPIYEFPVNIFSEIPLTSKSSDIYRNALQLIGASAIAGVGAAAGGVTAAFALANAAASATTVVNSKETVQKVGGTGGSIGFMGVQTPYLIINRPEQSVPDDYNKFYGYPCNMWETLGNLEGYTVVERIHLENIIATSEELDLIEKELKSGVIL